MRKCPECDSGRYRTREDGSFQCKVCENVYTSLDLERARKISPTYRCPSCDTETLQRKQNQKYQCTECETVSTLRHLRDHLVTKKEKKKSGSGVIAGPITIGRGSYWGAGA
jgi:ribosomal protein L37AE/L43A